MSARHRQLAESSQLSQSSQAFSLTAWDGRTHSAWWSSDSLQAFRVQSSARPTGAARRWGVDPRRRARCPEHCRGLAGRLGWPGLAEACEQFVAQFPMQIRIDSRLGRKRFGDGGAFARFEFGHLRLQLVSMAAASACICMTSAGLVHALRHGVHEFDRPFRLRSPCSIWAIIWPSFSRSGDGGEVR